MSDWTVQQEKEFFDNLDQFNKSLGPHVKQDRVEVGIMDHFVDKFGFEILYRGKPQEAKTDSDSVFVYDLTEIAIQTAYGSDLGSGMIWWDKEEQEFLGDELS